jgi:hypothetical protein
MATLTNRPMNESRSTSASLHQAIARGYVASADHEEHKHERDEYQVQHESIIEAGAVRERSRVRKEFVKTALCLASPR